MDGSDRVVCAECGWEGIVDRLYDGFCPDCRSPYVEGDAVIEYEVICAECGWVGFPCDLDDSNCPACGGQVAARQEKDG